MYKWHRSTNMSILCMVVFIDYNNTMFFLKADHNCIWHIIPKYINWPISTLPLLVAMTLKIREQGY